MKKQHMYFLTLAITFIFAAGDVSSLFAQETAAEEFTLEEITVTAQKREENSQKVPIAMEVISGEDLATLGKTNVDDILKDVANVFINTASDGMRIALRGIADDSNVMEDQRVGGSTVAVNVDGSYNNMSNAGQNLFDIERVEVLFGPQSTMYGSNAPGGIVNVVTAAPKTDKYSASGVIEYGSYELLNTQAVFNAPVVMDKLALRLAANTYKRGSFVNEDEDPSKTTSARLRALWQVHDELTFSVTGNWQKRTSGGMMGGSVVPFINQDDVDDPWTSDGTEVGANRDDQITKGISANIDWKTPFGTISVVPSYSKSNSEGWHTRTSGGGPGGPPPMSFNGLLATQQALSPQQDEETVRVYQERANTQKGAELRMTNAGDFELFQWILGGTYYKSEQENYSDYEDPTRVDSSRVTLSQKKALYGNITYPTWFNDRLRLTFGYRQSWDKNTSSSYGQRSETSGNAEGYSKPDFKYGFEYDVADNMMFFGSYSSSYRSGDAMAMPDAQGDVPDPEELDAYTVGLKSRFFGNKLQVNVSAYYYDYKNKLCTGFKEATGLSEVDLGFIDNNNNGVFDPGIDEDYISIGVDGRGNPSAELVSDGVYPTMDFDPETGEPTDADNDGEYGDIYNFQINDPNSQGTGRFKSLGLDLQTSWLITSKDKLNFSIAYLNAEWKDLHFHYYWNMYWPDENYEGVTPTNSPKLSMSASYEHNFMLGSYGTLTPRIDVQHKSEYRMVWNPADKDPYGYGTQEPYYMWDASVMFNHSSGRWSLNTYVKNITNYAVKRSYMGMMSFTMMIGDPRTYGATLSVKF